jgi:hypothetical protein
VIAPSELEIFFGELAAGQPIDANAKLQEQPNGAVAIHDDPAGELRAKPLRCSTVCHDKAASGCLASLSE